MTWYFILTIVFCRFILEVLRNSLKNTKNFSVDIFKEVKDGKKLFWKVCFAGHFQQKCVSYERETVFVFFKSASLK